MPSRKRSQEPGNSPNSKDNKLVDLARVTVGSLDSFEQEMKEMPEAAPEGFLFAAPKPGFAWQ